MNLTTSAVRSRKPQPRVCTLSSDVTMDGVLTTEGLPRASEVGMVMKGLFLIGPAWAGTRRGSDARDSNLSGDVLLHPVRHVDQAAPGTLDKRHHAVHVAVARQRNLDLALALRHLGLGLFQ